MRIFIWITISTSLITSAFSVELTCDFLVKWNTCKVTEIYSSSPNDYTVTKINGKFQTGRSRNDVTTIDGRGKTVGRFFLNLSKFLPNIDRIFFEKGMTEIHKEELAQFPNLKSLYMSFNQIEVIEPDLFINNPNLELVFIGENKIHTVAPNVFDGLKKLRYLGFDRNTCYDGHVENNREKTVELVNFIYENCALPTAAGECGTEVAKMKREFQKLTMEIKEWRKENSNYIKLMMESCGTA